MGGKLLNAIKSIHVNCLACVRVKRCERECFRINSGVRQYCIMFPWLFNVNMETVRKELKMGMGWRGERSQEKGIEWRLPDLMYADDLV